MKSSMHVYVNILKLITKLIYHSIFMNTVILQEMISAAGFKQVTYENLTFGTVAIHIGHKI